MIRLIFLIALTYVLYRLIFAPPKISFFGPGMRATKKTPRHPDAEEMVPCANCGTFIAKRGSEAKGGRFYCKPKCH